MLHRNFIRPLLNLAGLAEAAGTTGIQHGSPSPRLLIQESTLAGFQYHEGKTVCSRLQGNAPLQLVREPDNRYDERAVAAYWRNHTLGYPPSDENTASAAAGSGLGAGYTHHSAT
jgi:hypothetical protein